jgi:hypothetical protein
MDWRNPSHIQELCSRLEGRSRKGEIRDALQFFLRAARMYAEHLMIDEMRIQHRIDVWKEPGKGGGIIETLAIISDHKVAKAAFDAPSRIGPARGSPCAMVRGSSRKHTVIEHPLFSSKFVQTTAPYACAG